MRKGIRAPFDPKKFLAKVGDGKTILHYRKNQIVFAQGDVADAVFYIQQGNIKLIVVSELGKEAVVAILGSSHFFGEGCLNGHPLRIATARTVDECVITRLEKATMIATVHKEPEFSELFMSYLLTRNSRIEEAHASCGLNISQCRRARLMLGAHCLWTGAAGEPNQVPPRYSTRHQVPRHKFSAFVASDVTGRSREKPDSFKLRPRTGPHPKYGPRRKSVNLEVRCRRIGRGSRAGGGAGRATVAGRRLLKQRIAGYLSLQC